MHFTQKRRPRISAPGQSWRNKKSSTRKLGSTLDPSLFVKRSIPLSSSTYQPGRKIEDLPIDRFLINNLLAKGYIHPTEVQDRAIEPIINKKNVMGVAQTGTGKTAAFLIPIIHNLLKSTPAFQVLIVVPTRELAVQVQQEFHSIAKGTGLNSHCFIGGTSVGRDISLLRSKSHFVIGTPGRLVDLARQRALKFNMFNTLVLDEFDRLLDMGFSKDIQHIVQSMTGRTQTVLFSATEEPNQRKMINTLLSEAVEIKISTGKATGDHIDQEIVNVKSGEKKQDVLLKMVRDKSFHKVIVFAETKRGVSAVRKNLHQAGISVDEIHGNKSQNYRLKALNNFKTGRIQVLVATDVAARGLDISEVTHVINYQAPKDIDSYIHRIGRTGRAGKTGKAYTFIN